MLPEDIDKLFRERLEGHAPPPPAQLWAQLDEVLRPAQKRRAVWLWSAAAAVALLLVSGALWLYLAPVTGGSPARQTASRQAVPAGKKSVANVITWATPAPLGASTPPTAPATPSPIAGAGPTKGKRRGARQVVASVTRTTRPDQASLAGSHSSTLPATQVPVALAVDLPSPTQPERAALVLEAASALPPLATLAAAPPAATGPIEVEVHRRTAALAAEGARRSLGVILLRQARNVVRGNRVSLAETGLPETVTVQARVGSRTLTKVFQL